MSDNEIPRCVARSSRTGEQCKQRPIRGGTVCKTHGGATPQVKRKAAERLAALEQARTVELWGGRLDVSPAEALLELVQAKAAEVAYWRHRVSLLAGDDGGLPLWGLTKAKTGGQDVGDTYEARPPVEYRLLQEAERDLANFSAAALRAGATAAMLDVVRLQAAHLVETLRAVLLRAGVSAVEHDGLIASVLEIEGEFA